MKGKHAATKEDVGHGQPQGWETADRVAHSLRPTTYPEYNYKPNDMGMAYVLLILGGLFGFHRFYLGRPGSGCAMAALSISIIGLPVTLVWWIVDIFLVYGMFLEETNK